MTAQLVARYGKLALMTAAAMLVIYLLTRHLDHVARFLPLVVLFACPLVHIFMHGHHGRRADGHRG